MRTATDSEIALDGGMAGLQLLCSFFELSPWKKTGKYPNRTVDREKEWWEINWNKGGLDKRRDL